MDSTENTQPTAPLPRAIDLSAYRIVQEGLTNALKHAHASALDVSLSVDGDLYSVTVRDDGVGIADENAGHGHWGLQGMRERYQPQLEIVMRTYFEKPRTVVGPPPNSRSCGGTLTVASENDSDGPTTAPKRRRAARMMSGVSG